MARKYQYRILLLPLVLMAGVSGSQIRPAAGPGKAPAQPGPYRSTSRILHVPKQVLLSGYPYDIDLIVEFPADSVAAVLLFLRTAGMTEFREIPMTVQRARYRYHYNPREMPSATLEYYFVVILTNTAMYGWPVDDQGLIQPVKRIFKDPRTYFRERNLFKSD